MASVVWDKRLRCWRAYIYLGPGRRKTQLLRDIGPNEKKKAKAEAADLEHRLKDVPASEIDLDSAMKIFLDDRKVVTALATWERYQSTLLTFLDHIAPDQKFIRLRNVGDESIRTWRDERLRIRAASTVAADMKSLNAFFNWALARRWIDFNPCSIVQPPRVRRKHMRIPTHQEVIQILTQLKAEANQELYAMALFGAFGGMRRGDILFLKPEHIDFEHKRIYVFEGKSKEPRAVIMHPWMESFLMDWPLSGEYVFPSKYAVRSQKRSPAVGKQFNKWLKTNGYPFTHKSLRHFFNDWCRRAGLSPEVRELLMGHADHATNRIYTHPEVEEALPVVFQLGQGIDQTDS